MQSAMDLELEKWLLNSNIRLKEGENCGGYYGWKNLLADTESSKHPFIYNEIVGYSFSIFSYMYSESKKAEFLTVMKESFEYIKKNITKNDLLNAGIRNDAVFKEKGDIENQLYSFDNGIIIAGLVNYYKITKNQDVYEVVLKMANSLIKNFFRNYKICHALLNKDFKPTGYGIGKWSSRIGSFHAKVGIGFSDLFDITGNKEYLRICYGLCELAINMQEPDGSFLNNQGTRDDIFLHPHLYACEGLTYIGSSLNDQNVFSSGLKGIEWAISTITDTGGVPRSIKQVTDQADCTAQLLRLLLLYSDDLNYYSKVSSEKIEKSIQILHDRIKRFFIRSEGAVKYNDSSEFACTWCTMFSLQALILLAKRNKKQNKHSYRIEFFV
jgi:hypothetical protein